MSKEKIVQLKDVDIELGHLKIITTKKDKNSLLTGKDIDVFIDNKNFRDTFLKNLSRIQIDIGDAETICEVKYTYLPRTNK